MVEASASPAAKPDKAEKNEANKSESGVNAADKLRSETQPKGTGADKPVEKQEKPKSAADEAAERLRQEFEKQKASAKPELPKTPADASLPKVDVVEAKPVPKLDQQTLEKHAAELDEAMHRTKWLGLRSDADAAKVERILGPLSKADRDAIERIYEEKYSKDHTRGSLRKELKEVFGEAEGTRLESIVVRNDGRTNDAGQVRTALAKMGSEPDKANAELAQVFKQLNSEQIKQMQEDYKQAYGRDLVNDMKAAEKLSPVLRDSMDVLLKGSDQRTADDVVALTRKAMETGNRDMVVTFISGDSPSSTQARQMLAKDTAFQQQLAEKFPSTLAMQAMEYGFYDQLSLQEKTDKAMLDYFKQGHIGLDTITNENTGKWFLSNKDNVELAVKNATPEERQRFELGQKMARENRQPGNDQEKAAADFYKQVHDGFVRGGNAREVAIWEDNLAHGRPSIISDMAKTHSDGWDPMGWSAGHKKQDLMTKAENLSKQDWELLRDKEKGPAFRQSIEESLKAYADPQERERIMKILDAKAGKEKYEDAAKVGRTLEETINDNKGSVFLGMGTSYDGKGISDRIANMSPEDAQRYKDNAEYRKQIQTFVNENLNPTEKLYATRMLAQVEQTGQPPKETAVDKVLHDSIKGAKPDESLKHVEEALKDPALAARMKLPAEQLTEEEKQIKNMMENTVWRAVHERFPMPPEAISEEFRIAEKYSKELMDSGRLSLNSKLELGFNKADLLPDIAKAPESERQAAMASLNADEKKIVEVLASQNGEQKLEDRLRAFIVTGKGSYADFQEDLKKLDNAAKQELKDSYFKKYGGALNEDFLSKVDGNQGEKNIYRQYLNPSESDGRQDYYDNYRKFLDSRSGFSADGSALTAERAAELHGNALEAYQREFKKLTPEQQEAMNQYFGEALKQYQDSKEKLAEILVDATITAAALAAAPFTAGMSTAALLTVIGTAAASGAAYRVAMFKAIQGNDFDASAENILKQALMGGTTAALNFVGPELFMASSKFITAAGANVVREVAVSTAVKQGAEKLLATELEQLAAKRGLKQLTAAEVDSLVAKVAKEGISDAERTALRQTLEQSVNSNFQKAAAEISETVAKSSKLTRQMAENAVIGAGSNVASELIVAPFNKNGVNWDNLESGALTGLAIGAAMPVAIRGLLHLGGGAKTVYTKITRGSDGLYLDPAHITEPISVRNTKTGEIVTVKPGEGEKFKLTNDWQPESGGRVVPDDPRAAHLDLHPEPMARSREPFAQYGSGDYQLNINGEGQSLNKPVVTLGRDPKATDIQFADTGVSRQHAQIHNLPDGSSTIKDLGSSNGTFVNGRKLAQGESVRLRPGDKIKLGTDTEIVFGVKPEFHLDINGRAIDLRAGETTVGRSSDNNFVMQNTEVSRQHAKIAHTDNGPVITDLGSKNGTYVNGKRINPNEPVQLKPGDKVQFGKDGETYTLGKGMETPSEVRPQAAVEAQPRQVMEYKVRPGESDAAAGADAVRESNSYKRKGEIREPLRDGFQTLSGNAEIRADGSWNDPHRPSVVVDRSRDTVLNDALAEAHRRFDHLKGDPRRLAEELSKYSKEMMHPKGWTEDMVDASYNTFRNENRGKRVLLGDYIARAGRGEGAGVCQHQALLFKVLGDEFGMDTSLVSGFYGARPKGGLPKDTFANHAWNEVHIDGKTYVFDPRHERYGMTAEQMPKHNPARSWLSGENAAPVGRYEHLNLKTGDSVNYDGQSRWTVTSEKPEVPGNIVLRQGATRGSAPAEIAELNPGRKLVIGEKYKVRRSNGEIEDGWQLMGDGKTGKLQFYKSDGMRTEVSPRDLVRENPDLVEVRTKHDGDHPAPHEDGVKENGDTPTVKARDAVEPEAKLGRRYDPNEQLNPERVKEISRAFAERTREVPVTKDQFASIFSKFEGKDKQLAIELMEQSAPNMTGRALDDQMRSLQAQLDKLSGNSVRSEGMVVYTLSGDDTGAMMAQMLRKNHDQLEKKIRVVQLDAAGMKQLAEQGIPSNGLVFGDLSRATQAQKDVLKGVKNLYVTDLNGFDRGLNMLDFGAAQFSGPQAMQEKLHDLVERAKALQKAEPGLSNADAARRVMQGDSLADIHAVNPGAKVVKPDAPLPGRDLRAQVGGDESYRVSSLYDQFTAPQLTQEQMEQYLANIANPEIRSFAAHVLENGVEYKGYAQMMSEYKNLHQRILENVPPGTRPQDIMIVTGLEQPNIGSHLVSNKLYARANGLESGNFISAGDLAALGPGAAKGKVLVYLDDFSLSGRQAAGVMNKNAQLLRESGGELVVATIGRYETDVNPWTLYKDDARYADLAGLNVKVLSNHTYLPFYDTRNLSRIGLEGHGGRMGEFNLFKPGHDSGLSTYILMPYGGPNNNLNVIGNLQKDTGLRGSKVKYRFSQVKPTEAK